MTEHEASEASTQRSALAAAIEEIRLEQSEFRDQQSEFRDELKKNSELTVKNNAMTEEMFEIFAAAKGTFKVVTWIGSGVKWAAGIAASLFAMWLFFRGGPPPTR